MAATLSVLSTKNTKAAKELIPKLLEDCNQMGRDLPILAPCVNTSEDGFKVEYASTDSGLVPGLRYGLAGVRGVGSLADAILVERSAGGLFTDLQSFDSRLHQRLGRRPSRTALEALAYAGAFDSFFTHRSEALHHVQILREETKYKREELIRLGWQPERSALLAQKQAELCGNYYFVRDNLEVLGREVDNFFEAVKDDRITVGGRVVDAKLDKKTKKGSTYHRVTLKTQWGNVTVDFYAPWKSKDPNQYLADLRAKLFQGSVILVEGSVRDERTMWGYSVKLPKAQYQGVSTEPPPQLQQEAIEALYTREQFTVFTAPAAFE
jgi:DNA polymerase III alpha subunit